MFCLYCKTPAAVKQRQGLIFYAVILVVCIFDNFCERIILNIFLLVIYEIIGQIFDNIFILDIFNNSCYTFCRQARYVCQQVFLQRRTNDLVYFYALITNYSIQRIVASYRLFVAKSDRYKIIAVNIPAKKIYKLSGFRIMFKLRALRFAFPPPDAGTVCALQDK